MSIDLAALGFTQEELQQRVVNQIVNQILDQQFYDEDGEEVTRKRSTKFYRKLLELIQERIDSAVQSIGDEHVKPHVEEYVKNFMIQKTNEYGEAKGEPVTFTEYLVHKAESYLTETVDYDGRSEQETRSRGNSWYGSGKHSRIVYMLEKHMHYHIETAMKDAMKNANNAVVKGIEDTVRIKLAEISSALKVDVKIK